MSYTILNEIGHGGMGCVYKAQAPDGTIVALKMMSNQVACYPEYRELFSSEVDTLKRMSHPSVVRIVGEPYSDNDGNLYLPMEFVEGETLAHHLSHGGHYSVADAVRLMGQILDAMQYVHEQRRIHRDIKPSNIMLRPDGSVCVIDFGIAKDAKIGGTGKTVGRIIGTDGYMSPEQAGGLNIDRRTDIYSLGCLFFFLLTGKPAIPSKGNDYETIKAILDGNIEPPSTFNHDVSPAIDRVFFRSVNKDMTRRYSSCAEFKNALMAAYRGETPPVETSVDTSLQHSGDSSPRITVGQSPDNDICIANPYVSRHHLVVRGLRQPVTGGGSKPVIEVTDANSTNGTGIDGRPLRNTSMTFDYTDISQLPEVLLAARSECMLDWHQVVDKLKAKGWQTEIVQPAEQPAISSSMALLYLFLPVAGWIAAAAFRSKRPAYASKANTIAWIGMIMYFAMAIVICLKTMKYWRF